MNGERERFNENVFNKKTKEAIRRVERVNKMSKAKSLQRDNLGPLSQYYK